MVHDFNETYPDKADSLFTTLHLCREKIVRLAQSKTKSVNSLKEVTDLISEVGELSSDRNLLALVLLPYAISPPPAKKKKGKTLIKPSLSEQRDAFLFKLDDEAKLDEVIESKRNRLFKLKLPFQPWIVYVGHFLRPTKVFIIVDNVKYIVPSILEAVDVTFKIFQSTHAFYPVECENIWTSIQLGFFKLKTKYDRDCTTVEVLLNDLDLLVSAR